jgi:hypothetical protein
VPWQSSIIDAMRVDKMLVVVYYTCRAMQSRGFPPTLSFVQTIRVWPSGKAVDFGSTIPGSNPGTRASLFLGVVQILLLIRFFACATDIWPAL